MNEVFSKPHSLSADATGKLTPMSASKKMDDDHVMSPASVTTLVLWVACVVVGSLGLALPYSRPHPVLKQPEPIQVELLNVELSSDPLPPPDTAPPPLSPAQPPPSLDPVVAPQAPPMIAVAEPNPAIAFALPVEGPTRVVEAKQASYAREATQTTASPTTAQAQTLTFGRGEGKQLAPEYPPRARREGQEGTVGIRFTVSEEGRVLAAETIAPAPWALLNQAALRAVRERWRFPAGAVRVYEVSIRFELTK